MKELMLIIVGSALVNNVVLSQFLGLCPFLGVSKKTETAAGMGGAVIFVITLSSFVTSVIYQFILVPTHMEYLQTIVFILIIAALVQFVEMFLKKAMPSLYQAPVSYTHLGACRSQKIKKFTKNFRFLILFFRHPLMEKPFVIFLHYRANQI